MKIFIKWLRNNYVILSLVFVVAFIISIPLSVYGLNGAFYYRYDPDIVYIANALLYTKAHIIEFYVHPGTPTIMSIYWLFVPTRLIAKYIFHEGFIQWTFDNYSLMTMYLRIFQLFLFGTSLVIFLKAVKNISKSIFITMLTLLAFLSLANNWHEALWIAPEGFSFFLSAIWLFVFVNFMKKRTYLLNTALVVIAGFAVANKLTNGFLLIPILLFPFFSNELRISQKLGRTFFNLLISGLAFVLGTWSIINRYSRLFRWVGILFNHTKSYGEGNPLIFDPTTYFTSSRSLIMQEPVAFAVICGTLILAAYLLIKRRLKITDPVVVLFLTTLVGIVIFAKYDTVRYHFVNYILVLFCSSYFISKIKTNFLKIVAAFLAVTSVVNGYLYLSYTFERVDRLTILQNYYDKNPPIFNTLWGVDNKYNIINHWTIYWVANVFGEQFNAKPLFMLSKDLTEVNVIGFQETLNKNIFGLCWDQAYLTKEDATKFLTIYKDKKLTVKPLPVDNNVYQITSNHCMKSKIKPEIP